MNDDTKSLLASKTFWGALAAIVSTILQARGVVGADGLVNEGVTIIGGLLSIYGRVTATQKIGGS